MSNSLTLNGRVYKIKPGMTSGQFGTVFKGKDSENVPFAFKEIQLRAEDHETLNPTAEELRHLLELKHEHLLNIFHLVITTSHQNPQTTSLYLVTEQADSNLNTQLRYSSNDNLQDAKWIMQITSGITFLHSKGYRHCNLKPENVLITKVGKNVRLSDFAVVNELRALQQRISGDGEAIGNASLDLVSQLYWAPETLCTCKFTDESDVFSLGSVLYGILKRQYTEINGVWHYGAFVGESENKRSVGAYLMLNRNETCVPLPHDVSDLDDKILAALYYDPAKRPTAGYLLEEVTLFYTERLQRKRKQNEMIVMCCCSAFGLAIGLVSLAAVVVAKIKS